MSLNATVRLIDNQAGTSIVLKGTQNAAITDPFDVTLLEITRGGTLEATLTVARPIQLPPAVLKSDGGGDFHLVRPASRVDLDLEFTVSVNVLLGTTFDLNAGVRVQLSFRLLPAASTDLVAIDLLVSGCVRLGIVGGTNIFSQVPIGFHILVDDVPLSASPAPFPSSSPALVLDLPGDIPWPEVRLPWSFPLAFPTVENTIRFPAYRVPLFDVALQLGWDAIRITADTATPALIIEVQKLRVVGAVDLSISLRLQFTVKGVTVTAFDDPYNLCVNPATLRQLAPGCFGIDATANRMTPLLGIASSELGDDTAGNQDYKLRVHAPEGVLEEVRIDWAVGAGARSLRLPGFKIDLDALLMFSLVLSQPDGESARAAVVATFSDGKPVKVATAFGWTTDQTEQEKFRDATDHSGGGSPSLLELDFEIGKPLSVALVNIPFGGSHPARFLRKLVTPLPLLDDIEIDGGDGDDDAFVRASFDPCPTVSLDDKSLLPTDVKNVDLKVNGNSLKLPFLDGPLPGNGQQLLEVVGLQPYSGTNPPPAGFVILRDLVLRAHIADLELKTRIPLMFDVERLAFSVTPPSGLDLFVTDPILSKTFLGLNWTFTVTNPTQPAFRLAIDGRNYSFRQLPNTDITISYDRATMDGDAIDFHVRDFALTPKGVTLTAQVSDKPARLNGLETQFKFTDGTIKIVDSRIAGFTIAGTGPLPPALIDNAVADIALQFEQNSGGNLFLKSGAAKVHGPKLLSCKATRFEFELDALGLRFVHEGNSDHLYFTVSGKARYKLAGGDDTSGPLAWLPGLEIQLVDCPLTGNAQVIAKHVSFLIELPKKVQFSFLGCFTMELRAIGFVPQFDKFPDGTSAMRLSGQIMFADTGDLVDAKIDLHDLYVALPVKGSFVPRLYLKSLGIRIAQGDAFALEAAVDFFNGEEIEPGINAYGFTGEGSVTIKGLPAIAASLAWLRVSNDGGQTWKRAWFIYLEARKMSLQIPVVEIFIREIGLGFGYRYTLAAFKAVDQIDDPKKLLKALKDLSRTQGNLSRRDQWRVDLEGAGEDPRWTIVFRALFASVSAQATPFTGYDDDAEAELSSLYIFDAVLAVRSDLTFFLAGRAWLNTNYNDFLTRDDIKNGPLLSGFMMLSPRQKRFLANLSSNPNAQFGDHPPIPDFLKELIRGSQFTATLLIEPGLLHYELGWPNQLQMNAKLGPLDVQVRAGTIFRLSGQEMVVGNSFLARGKLELSADFSAGFFGAGLYALADVAYGARYIGVLAFNDPVHNSALYGAIGIDIKVQLDIRFWLRIKLGFFKISIDLSVSFQIQFTAALQVGILLSDPPGALGTATVAVQVMGRTCGFNIRVGINDGAVNRAQTLTSRFLNVGLEAEDVEAVPGTSSALAAPAVVGPHISPTPLAVSTPLPVLAPVSTLASAIETMPLASAPATPPTFHAPEYYLGQAESADEADTLYFVLIPRSPHTAGELDGFFPVPPDNSVVTPPLKDFILTLTSLPPTGVTLEHSDATGGFMPVTLQSIDWMMPWAAAVSFDSDDATTSQNLTYQDWLRLAYVVNPPFDSTGNGPSPHDVTPIADPMTVLVTGMTGVTDQRVQNPSDSAYEAAVRGAMEQFAVPYFKFDQNSDYDSNLLAACQPETSVYTPNGKAPAASQAQSQAPTADQSAHELRGAVVQAITRDFFDYAGAPEKRTKLKANSLAFKFGLIFRVKGPRDVVMGWMESGAQFATIRQRNTSAADALSTAASVRVFNRRSNWFTNRPPSFEKVRTYTHANTIAIDWTLQFSGDPNLLDDPAQREIEHHLRYYTVRREQLGGNDPTVEFTLKPADVLHRPTPGGDIVRIPPRFQLVDHFADQANEDIAALTASGKTYMYTITPADTAGQLSPRPLTVVATRYPADPPPVPADGELVVTYGIASDVHDVPPPGPLPLIRKPIRDLTLRFSDPVMPSGQPTVPAAKYHVVFRREEVLPIGFYGADERIRGVQNNGVAVSNARRLRTDIVFTPPLVTITDDRADNGRGIRAITIPLADLATLGVFPGENATWRPEGWTIFLQTESESAHDITGAEVGSVRSSLAAVSIRFRFEKQQPQPLNPDFQPSGDDRQFARLEWLPNPVLLNLLPPTDVATEPGFAKVPMPSLNDPTSWLLPIQPSTTTAMPGLSYEQHPARLRAVKLVWNQGPSDDPTHPLDLHARYQVYEFDAFALPGDVLETGGNTMFFPDWAARANISKVQEVDLIPPEDLGDVPSNASDPLAWEAWYPSTSRRLLVKQNLIQNKAWPPTSEAIYGPWYSFRDSFLQWPDVTGLVDNSGARITGFHPLLENLAGLISRVLPGSGGSPFYAECGPHPARGGNQERADVSDPNPIKYGNDPQPGALDKFLAATASESDPYGWGVLQRMGLAMGLRIRDRSNASSVRGADLLQQIRNAIALQATHRQFTFKVLDPQSSVGLTVKVADNTTAYRWSVFGHGPVYAAPFDPANTNNDNQFSLPSLKLTAGNTVRTVILDVWGTNLTIVDRTNLSTATETTHDYQYSGFLHVEQLIQPGKRMIVMPLETDAQNTVPYDTALSLVQLSLRPRVIQTLLYRKFRLDNLQSGQLVDLLLKDTGSSATNATFMQRTGTPGVPLPIPTGAQGSKVSLRAALDGTLEILVRASDPTVVSISKLVPNPTDPPHPNEVAIPHTTFTPADWECSAFTVPFDPRNSANPHLAPFNTGEWNTLKQLIQGAEPAVRPNELGADANPRLFAWLDRFFAYGGDLVPRDGTVADATTHDDVNRTVWIASAYLRAATPLPLSPDNAGRLTAYRPIESLWAQCYRYFVRPRGRYELLWEELGRTELIIDKPYRNKIGWEQQTLKKPVSGGADVALPRIRPITAPLVLSSRRLDPLLPSSTTAPPGSTWEVYVAGHPEQELVERNRSLVNHLEYRQISAAIVRTFDPDPDKQKGQVKAFARAVSRVVSSPASNFEPDTPTLLLELNGTHQIPINRGADTSLNNTAALISAAAAGVTAKMEPIGTQTRLVLETTSPNTALRLLTAAGTPSLVSTPEDVRVVGDNLSLPTWQAGGPAGTALPELPAQPERLDLSALTDDAAATLDLPLRTTQFGRSALVLQYAALPYFYKHRMLLVAQSSAVVSAVTVVDQEDFEYVSPPALATMEGVRPGDGNGSRVRRIMITLARLWDCLPPAAQQAWQAEDPAKRTDTKRRPSAFPDPDVTYSVALKRLDTGNIEVVAEYRFNKDELTSYESVPMPGPFRGEAIRINPDAPAHPGVDPARLETLLLPQTADTFTSVVMQPISSRRVLTAHSSVPDLVWPADTSAVPSCCELHANNAADTDLQALMPQVDETFRVALRGLLGQTAPERVAAACVGLEQLAEIHDSVAMTPQFGDPAAPGQVVWTGSLNAAQKGVIGQWIATSAFNATFQKLLDNMAAAAITSAPFADTVVTQPQINAQNLASRLSLTSPAAGQSQLKWLEDIGEPTADELTRLANLLPADGDPSKPALLAFVAAVKNLSHRSVSVAVIEPFWKPRPTRATLPASLRDTLLVGNGVVGFNGPMERAEAVSLQAGLAPVDQKAIRDLYSATLLTGLHNAELRLITRRGSATMVSASITTAPPPP